MDEVRCETLARGVYVATRPMEGGLAVRAGLILGSTKALVIDTLTRPEDMSAFAELARAARLPVTVVLTHADWDHAWGTAAFANATIVAHSICYDRLKSRAAREELERRRRERAGEFRSVRLLKPTATFEVQMTIDAGDFEVELHHLPGHTADSIVAFVPKLGMLFAGDCVESPFPLLESGPLGAWAAQLRAWAARATAVVPAHGAIAGRELLLSNAEYLESLPLAPPSPAGLLPFYSEAHARNVAVASRLRSA